MDITIKLYYLAKRDRSARIRWLLHELSLPYQEYQLNYKEAEHKSEQYRQINPFGLIPGIEINHKPMFESAAIVSYLLELYPDSNLCPPPGSPQRSDYLQWLFFTCSTFEESVMKYYFLKDTPENTDLRATTYEKLEQYLNVLTKQLQQNNYLLGESFSAVDIMLGYLLLLLKHRKILGNFPAMNDYLIRVTSREAAQKAEIYTE